MTQQEFENYLALMGRLLKLSDRQREAISGELDDHLHERLEDLQSQGVPREEAVRLALEEFGDAAALARDFQEVSRNRKKRWIMRMTVGSLSVALAGLLIVSLYWPAGHGPAPQQVVAQEGEAAKAEPENSGPKTKMPPSPDDRNRRTVEILKQVSEIDVDYESLQDVMQLLSDLHNINVYIDERALQDSDKDSSGISITMSMSGVPLEMILDLILSQHGLTYSIRSGILIITTQEEAEGNPVVRVYNVHSLLAAKGQQKNLEHLTEVAQNASKSVRHLRTGLGQDHFVDNVLEDNGVHAPLNSLQESLNILKRELQNYSSEQLPSYASRMEILIQLIYSTIDSTIWEVNGGLQGVNILPFKGSLIISSTERTHRKIEKLLQELEIIAKQNADAPFLPLKKNQNPNENKLSAGGGMF